MNAAKKLLKSEAEEAHPGKNLSYCGTKTNWDDCFTIVGDKLIFWYNVGKNTHANSIGCCLIEN
jgi:hypothetical protein